MQVVYNSVNKYFFINQVLGVNFLTKFNQVFIEKKTLTVFQNTMLLHMFLIQSCEQKQIYCHFFGILKFYYKHEIFKTYLAIFIKNFLKFSLHLNNSFMTKQFSHFILFYFFFYLRGYYENRIGRILSKTYCSFLVHIYIYAKF